MSVRYEYDRLIDAISFAARMASQGRNVNIIVSDIKTVLSQLDQREEEEALVLGHTHKTAVVIKKLVSLAGASSADICTSLLVACNENDKNDEFIKLWLSRAGESRRSERDCLPNRRLHILALERIALHLRQ